MAADLDGGGVTDLIVRNAGDGTLSVFLGNGQGWFLAPVVLQVGLGVSDIEAAALEQNGLLDIVYSNEISGEVGVIDNLGGGTFASPVIYQAGPGPYGVTGTADPSPVFSLEGTTSVAAGYFTPGNLPSLVAVNPGSNTFGLLSGLGNGLLANEASFPTPESGLVVRTVYFNDSGLAGLAVLGPEGLYVYVSNGDGGFLPPTYYNVGFEPNGLTVADLTNNGTADLLVSNALGDVQVLYGNGDGGFSPGQNLDQQVSLAVYAPSGSTPAAFIFADQLTDQVVVKTVGGVTTVLGSASTGLISPSAVALAPLDPSKPGVLDLIVANGGSNNVLVYPGLGNGAFGPALNGGNGFFTGTNPAGITVADLNGRPDLVIANEGSNTVSILFNVQAGNSFTFEPGPQLDVGYGPVATAVVNLPGSTTPDLLVANNDANDVWLLPGLGNGFFNDQVPTIFPVGINPTALFVGQFSDQPGMDLVTVNSGSDSVSLVSGLGTATPVSQSMPSGGIDPTAAIAVGLTANGPQSLLVANNADGNFSLFQPDDNGLALSSVLSSSGLPNPSGLALASFTSANLEFYATNDGAESASVLGFQLEESATASALSASTAGPSAQLLSLNETSLALVGTLLTVSLNLESEAFESGEAATGAPSASGPGGAGNSLLGSKGGPDEIEATVEPTGVQPAANALNPLSWARFVIGLDQAIEAIRKEVDTRLLREQQPAPSVKQPDTTLQEPDDTAPATVKTSFLEEAVFGTSYWQRAQDVPNAAIDAAIGALGSPDPAALKSIFPILPDSTLTRPHNPSARVLHVKDRTELFGALDPEPPRVEDSHVGKVATLVGLAALATAARASLLNRSTLLGGAGSPPTRESRGRLLNRRHHDLRKLGRG